MRASSSTSAVRRPFRRSVTEISRRLTADEGAALATVVGSQSQLLVMAADDNPDRRALAEDLSAHNAAHHEELFHIIEHTDPMHRAQSDQMEFASGTGTQSSAQNNARARINQSDNEHISAWRAAADMALDEMDPAARAQVMPQLPSGLYAAPSVDGPGQPTSSSTSPRPRKVMRRSEEIVRHTEANGSWPSDGSTPPEASATSDHDISPRYAPTTSAASTTSYHGISPRYDPTEGTETESYDLSNITRSPNSAHDPITGSNDSSAAGSPGRQSTDTDGTSTPPIEGVHGVAAVDSYYGYYSPTREFGLDRDC